MCVCVCLGKQVFVWGQLSGSSLGLGDNEKDSAIPLLLPDIDGTGYKDISCGVNHTAIVTGYLFFFKCVCQIACVCVLLFC